MIIQFWPCMRSNSDTVHILILIRILELVAGLLRWILGNKSEVNIVRGVGPCLIKQFNDQVNNDLKVFET